MPFSLAEQSVDAACRQPGISMEKIFENHLADNRENFTSQQ